MDTVDANLALGHEADERDWNDSVEIIANLGLTSLMLLTNNPLKSDALSAAGFEVVSQVMKSQVNESNRDYLLTKQNRMSHTLEIK
jgi:3,4-dihydroxy 2-butanone 4-phosphate synthase/GTP cyclohydrolase II